MGEPEREEAGSAGGGPGSPDKNQHDDQADQNPASAILSERLVAVAEIVDVLSDGDELVIYAYRRRVRP
jgi:hypothetical protein